MGPGGIPVGLLLILVIVAVVVAVSVRLAGRGRKRDSRSDSETLSRDEESGAADKTSDASTGPKTCPDCNHVNPSENNFCENCGARLT